MATIKTALQNVAATIGVKAPDSFVGNSEATARRLLRAGSQAGRHLRTVHPWRSLVFEHTFTTVSGTLEYALPTDPAFHHLLPNTAFDRTLYRSLVGPMNPAGWQYGEALLVVSGGLEHRFRIKSDTSTPRADKFYLLDDPAAAVDLAFEYVTHEWLYDGSSTYKETISADTDVPLFDDYLFECEVTWRALKLLGEQYFDEKDEATRLCDRLFAQEGGKQISMRRRAFEFAENIPEGNWS